MTEPLYPELRSNLEKIRQAIHASGGREVRIIAVTKTHPPEIFREVAAAGLTDIGENRIQEFTDKLPALEQLHPRLRVHIIGPIQTNKIRFIAGKVHSVDSLQSMGPAQALEKKLLQENAPAVEALLQINSTGEDQKSGFLLSDLPSILDFMESARSFQKVNVAGLMTMGPTPTEVYSMAQQKYRDDTEACFEKTRILKETLESEMGLSLPRLSMGMSHDFPLAVAQGASEIRLGTILFGQRQ